MKSRFLNPLVSPSFWGVCHHQGPVALLVFAAGSAAPHKPSVLMLSWSPSSRRIRAEGAADTWVQGARAWFLLPELAGEQIPSCLTKLMDLKWGFGTLLCSHEKGGGRGLPSVLFTKQMVTPQNNEWYNYKSNCRDHCDVLLHYER